MAKFINNSKVATFARRAAAEGISFEKMIIAIRKVSTEHAKTAGMYGSDHTIFTDCGMATEVSEVTSYHGGYMYVGGYVVASDGTQFEHLHHSVHNYDRRDTNDFYDGNLALLSAMADGTTIKLGYERDCSDWNIYERVNGVWSHIEHYDGMERYWATESARNVGYILYTGVRQDVATECGYELNDSFHWAFDQAIEMMNNA